MTDTVKVGGLVGVLNGKGLYTVFAPTNEGFSDPPAGTVAGVLRLNGVIQVVGHVLMP